MHIMTDRGWQPLWTITADADNGLVAPEWPALAGRHNHEEALVIKSSRAQFITNQRNLLKALRKTNVAAQFQAKQLHFAVRKTTGLWLAVPNEINALEEWRWVAGTYHRSITYSFDTVKEWMAQLKWDGIDNAVVTVREVV